MILMGMILRKPVVKNLGVLFDSSLKGTVHPKMKIMSLFTKPQVGPNLSECVCSEHKGRYFEESL